MYDRLFAAYGPQSWWPAPTPFEVVVGAYLTQNTSWLAVERSLANLREAQVLTLEGMRGLSTERLSELIRPSGYYTRKAPALQAFIRLVDQEFAGSLRAMSDATTGTLRLRLLQLPGVGPETADVILLYALGHSVPVADEYLRRVVERHSLLPTPPRRDRRSYEALVQLTRDGFAGDPPQDRARLYNEFHALTVAVGKTHCGPVARCEGCPLAFDLPSARSRQ